MISISISLLACLLLLVSVLPLLPIAHGFVRSFDFCRLQIIAIAGFTLIAAVIGVWFGSNHILAAVAAGLALLIQTAHVLPFTPIWRPQTARFSRSQQTVDTLSLLTCNVKQSNRDFDSVAKQLKERLPDVAVFLEVDEEWHHALRTSLVDYPHVVAQPQDNSYGMLLVSRLPLNRHTVRFLLNKDVPSMDVEIGLRSGRVVRLIALHPEPPIPIRDTEARDAEILLAGELARLETKPTIVAGDLNDVAWSRTTRRFLRISRLLDPRQGRGLYNSFDARRWYLRWPLDHIFHSRDFELIEIARLPFVGSDHFPMYYCLALTDHDRNNLPATATLKDKKEADQVISAEMARDRKPVGEDWEARKET